MIRTFHMSIYNTSLVISMKPKVKDKLCFARPPCCFTFYKITLIYTPYFSNMYSHTKLSGAIVAPTLQIIKFAMLLLAIVQKCGSFCGKFNENPWTSEKVIRGTDTRALYKRLVFFLKEIRLILHDYTDNQLLTRLVY
jgi:hypothetical protein